MANVNAQSVEDFADRIIYRFPAGRYEQAALGNISTVISTGLKTLANTDTSRSYIIPSSGISARFFKIEWVFNMAIQVNNYIIGYDLLIDHDFIRYSTPAPALNYDGKTLQTEFYERKTENYYQAQQLRSINIKDIAVEPKLTDLLYVITAQFDLNLGSNTNKLVALLQPIVTFYKK